MAGVWNRGGGGGVNGGVDLVAERFPDQPDRNPPGLQAGPGRRKMSSYANLNLPTMASPPHLERPSANTTQQKDTWQ